MTLRLTPHGRTRYQEVDKMPNRLALALATELVNGFIVYPFGDPILPPINRFAIHAQKLVELLEHGGGRYDYLMSLLDSLHGEAFPNGNVGGMTHRAGAWTMPDKD